MDKNQNNWIALYLSGQYPGFYTIPDRLNFFDELKTKDHNYNDVILGQFQSKSDIEFFYGLLNLFQKKHSEEEYNQLLIDLQIPEKVKSNPKEEKKEEKMNLKEIEDYLDGLNETGFSKYVILPILQAMGYKDIEYKGKVSETDFGLDFYPVKFISPGGITHYAGIQTKAKKMTDGDTTGSELNKLIEETKTAFGQKHNLNTGEPIKISEYIVFNSKEILQSARDKYFKDENVENRKIKLYGIDGVLSLIEEYNLNIG